MGKSMSTAQTVKRSIAPQVEKKVINAIHIKKPNQKVSGTVSRAPEPSAEYLANANRFDASFNDRLKQVFVTSANKNVSMELSKDRMPLDRTTPYHENPHSQSVDQRTDSKLLVEDVKKILLNFRENPEKWTVEYISNAYKIDPSEIEKLVKNYGSLEVYLSNKPSESDKYLVHPEESTRRLYKNENMDLYEMEDIIKSKRGKKWKDFVIHSRKDGKPDDTNKERN